MHQSTGKRRQKYGSDGMVRRKAGRYKAGRTGKFGSCRAVSNLRAR